MKKLGVVMMMFALLLGCGYSCSGEKTISEVDPANRKDDLILGYKFGMSHEEARAITDSLSNKGILGTYTTKEFGTKPNSQTMGGYSYTLPMGEKRIKTLLKPVFRLNRLERLDFYIVDRTGAFEAVEKEYGKPGTVIPDDYEPFYVDNILNFWNNSNQAVYYLRMPTKEMKGSYDILIFEDIIGKRESAGQTELPQMKIMKKEKKEEKK